MRAEAYAWRGSKFLLGREEGYLAAKGGEGWAAGHAVTADGQSRAVHDQLPDLVKRAILPAIPIIYRP